MKPTDILSPSQFIAMFPNAVPGAINKNREQWERMTGAYDTLKKTVAPFKPPAPAPAARKQQGAPRQRKDPNATEARFLARLESEQAQGRLAGRIIREGITLRWPDGMTYTPDVVIWRDSGFPILFEVKGGYFRRTGLEKFRAARAYWPQFTFEMWQWKKGEWKRVL